MNPAVLFFILELAVLATAVVFAVIIIRRWRRLKERPEKLARVARELDLRFTRRDPLKIPRRFAIFEALGQGRSRRASNVLSGQRRGRRIAAFDYRYVTGSGDNETVHHLSAAVTTCDCRFPALVVRPEGLLDKLAAAVGREDIDFESDEFSRKFHVTSEDRKFAYDLIHPEAMELLLQVSGWSLETHGYDVLLWTDRHWEPEEFRTAVEVLEGFVELTPDHLRKELKRDRS